MLLNNIKILSWNIPSLASHLEKGAQIYDVINEIKPDIVFLQETCMTDWNSQKRPIIPVFKKDMMDQGYIYFDIAPSSNPKWSCHKSAFMSKIKPITWDVIEYLGAGRIVTMTFSDVFIIAVYGHNIGRDLQWPKEKLGWTKLISSLTRPNTLYLGDLNVIFNDIDLWVKPGTKAWEEEEKMPGSTPLERNDFKEFVEKHGYKDLYREKYPDKRAFTYYGYMYGENADYWAGRSNKGKRLDYFMYNGKLDMNDYDVKIIQKPGSDHLPILFEYKGKPKLVQELGTVKFKDEYGTRIFRQSDSKSHDKPLYKMFEYADYHRHHLYIAVQNAELSYQFMSFADTESFESFYAKHKTKNFYEVIRGRCKLYFDLDNVQECKSFLKTLSNYIDCESAKIMKSSKGFHIILDHWFSTNEEIKDLSFIQKLDIDHKVYTKNRLFRLLYSSKFGKDDPFLPVDRDGKKIKNVEATQYLVSLA